MVTFYKLKIFCFKYNSLKYLLQMNALVDYKYRISTDLKSEKN